MPRKWKMCRGSADCFSFRWPVVGVKSAMSSQKHVEFRVLPISHSGLQKKHTVMALVQLCETIWMCLKILKVVCSQHCNFNIFNGKIVIYNVIFGAPCFLTNPKFYHALAYLEWPLGSCCSVFMLVFSANHESGSVRGVQRAWGTAHQWRDHRDCAEGVSRWVGMPCAFFCCSMDPLDPWDLGGWQDRVLESFEFSRKEHSYTTPLVVSVSMFAVVWEGTPKSHGTCGDHFWPRSKGEITQEAGVSRGLLKWSEWGLFGHGLRYPPNGNFTREMIFWTTRFGGIYHWWYQTAVLYRFQILFETNVCPSCHKTLWTKVV